MTHCSECRRRLRLKTVPGGLGGNVGSHPSLGYTDWLNHAKRPMCSRYGQAPDLEAR